LALRVLRLIVRLRYKATTSKATEDLVFSVVICRMFKSVRLLQLFVVTSYKRSINTIINPNSVLVTYTWQ
jgi:hypothetical protein